MALEQGELFHNTHQSQPSQDASGPKVTDPAPVWLQRASLVVFVVFCFYIGGLLTILPWWGRYWEGNGWLISHPSLDNVLQQGWVRGLISGIGLLDVWIGISEIIHYRDYRP